MRSYKLVAVGVLTGLIVACGAGKKDDKAANSPTTPAVSPEEKAARDALYADVPGHAIVRVAVNEKGEAIGAPEMRIVASKDSIGDASQAIAAFDGGAAPAKMVVKADELDSDRSTQSWTSWDYYDTYNSGGYGNNGGYGNTGGGGYGSGSGYGNGGGSYPQPGYDDNYDNDWGNDYDDSYDDGYGNGGGGGGGYGGGGYGGGSSCGSYCGNWGHNYWQSQYKPVLYYKGYGWNYGALRPSYYNQGGYNYYCYDSNKYW